MSNMSLLSLCSFFIYLLMGFYILIINPRAKTHVLFSLTCLFLCIWSISAVMYHSAPDRETYLFWYKLGGPGFFFFIALILHFFIILTERKAPLLLLAALYVPGAVLYAFKLNNYFIISNPEHMGTYWLVRYDYDSPLFYIFVIYILSYVAASMVQVWLWGRKAGCNKTRRQARVILFSMVLSLFGALADLYLIPSLFVQKSVSVTYFIPLIWLAGIMYSIIRYRFLSITPAHLSREILSNIEEGIILLDQDRNVVTVNEKTREILGKKEISIEDIRNSIFNYEEVGKNIDRLLDSRQDSFSYRLSFFDKDGRKVLADTRFSVIKDKFKDSLGILIIVREVKGIRQLQSAYRLTDRETEVILHLLSGQTNQEIAERLFISLNTAKRHISNIYIKLDVFNKVQLLNLVQNFGLLPGR